MTDRRRLNGPAGGTAPPVFSSSLQIDTPVRHRGPKDLRRICELILVGYFTFLTCIRLLTQDMDRSQNGSDAFCFRFGLFGTRTKCRT